MLPEEKVEEVKWLLSMELSQREVARRTGVSRCVVHRIATGKRKGRRPPPSEPWDVDRTGQPFTRCPDCGSLVQLPCHACLVRAATSPATRPKRTPALVGLELKDEHRERYEQVKAWREAQEDPNFKTVPPDWPFCRKEKGRGGRPNSKNEQIARKQ